MSTRPGATGPTRLNRPVGWLRDRPIWTKLGLIMIVPTLATIVVGVQSLFDHVQDANNADRARTLAVLSGDAGGLVHELQNERAGAIMLLDIDAASIGNLKASFEKQQALTDKANVDYRFRRSTLADVPDNLKELLVRIEKELGELPQLRSQITARTKIPLNTADNRYGVLIADLLEIRDLSAQLTGDATLTDRMRAAAAIAQAKEELSEERVVALQALSDGELSQEELRKYLFKRAGQERAMDAFEAVATPEQRLLRDEKVTGAQFSESLRYEGALDAYTVGKVPAGAVPLDKWNAAMVARSNLLNDVEVELNTQAEAAATERGDTVQRQVLTETGLLLLTLLLGVLFAWLVARSMARSLRDLRQGALAVAQYGLPQAVARLRDPALAGQFTPQQIAGQIADALPVRSKDEFGQVTEAFNAVHMEAVRTAAEQAALRASVATMFVNLARRSQILVDRLIGHLDRLERGEQDPDRLSELFQLDHLATRMRRNDENLLVLAGADSTRIQREPAALVDVLRAAQSEVEHYTRIEFGIIDSDIEIAAHAVNDLVHLVAELFDNATAFSPPDSRVLVEARRNGDRAMLQVADRGIGMSSEQYSELNERLATPPLVDVAVSRMMGLVVVARLASRHSVKVELRPAADRGTAADVLLPSAVLVPRALAGRTQTPAGFPASRTGPEAPPQRPVFAPPLALESGPTSPGGVPLAASSASSWPPSYAEPGPGSLFGPPNGPPQVPASPVPTGYGPGPTGNGLGAALAGGMGGNGNGTNGSGSRNLPAWHDLTGASTNRPADSYGWGDTGPGPQGIEPLPQRRPVWPGEGEESEPSHDTGPAIPRQMPSSPEARVDYAAPAAPYAAPQPAAPPAGYGQPPEYAPTEEPSGFSAPPPPVWPPVASDLPEDPLGGDADRAVGSDFTAEIPRVRPDGSDAVPAPPSRYTEDLTMELPIFRELESAWFRVAQSAPATPAGQDEPAEQVSAPAAEEPVEVAAAAKAPPKVPPAYEVPRAYEPPAAYQVPAGYERTTPTGAAMAGASMSGGPQRPSGAGRPGAPHASGEVSWRTAADDGWTAAQSAAQPQDAGVTETGLPKRVPMAQLVPGGVETPAPGTQRRSPDAVRGLLSAYHRGVQRGRGAQENPEEPTPTDRDSSREQEA